MILTVVVVPDDPKPPAKRADTTYGLSRTPVRGVPILPRQDDQAVAAPVPTDFANVTDPITGVHRTPEADLAARVRRTQHATERAAVTTLSIDTRVGVIETDVADLKTGVQLVQLTLEAQNKYMEPLVELVVSGKTLEHTREKSTLERDTFKEIDQLKARDATRERWTLTYKNASTVAAPVLAALASVLAAIHWGHC